MKRIVMFSLLVAVASAVSAQQMGGQGMAEEKTGAGSMMGSGQPAAGQMGGQGMMGQSDAALADGEIRKVNMDAKKLTIRHGAIPSMDMPPMTMVYQVKDEAMLGQVKAGDKVKFMAEKIGGAYVVTRIAPAE